MIFKMSVGYVKSDFELQNPRLWQEIWIYILNKCEAPMKKLAHLMFILLIKNLPLKLN